MSDPVLIQPPASEPVSLEDAHAQLRLDADFTDDDSQLARLIRTARVACENYARCAFITQRWLLRLDGFPGSDWRYNWCGYPAITLPKPPFQSIDFVKYVDTFGAVQTLPLDTTYGNSAPQYGYQLFRGSETSAARLTSSWARPWPPTRMVPSNVMVQYRCGFGQPVTLSMAAGSKVPAIAGGIKFNADDAPLMAGDTGLPIIIPGAGAGSTVLNTFIASVDSNGAPTLADAAATAVTNETSCWAGYPLPDVFTQAILLTLTYFYERRGESDTPPPGAAMNLLEYYRNLVA